MLAFLFSFLLVEILCDMLVRVNVLGNPYPVKDFISFQPSLNCNFLSFLRFSSFFRHLNF